MADTQPVDDPLTTRFTWTIDNFSRLNVKNLRSDVFNAGGYKWRILIYPKGNNVVDYFSMYLDAADSGNLPYGWNKYAQFSLSVVNQVHGKFSIKKETQHHFNARESDWGFTSFMPLGELHDPGRGYLVNDTCIFEADVNVLLIEKPNKNELKRKEQSNLLEEPASAEADKGSSPFAEFDMLFADIHNLVEGKTSKVENLSSYRLHPSSAEEIADAKKIFEQCLNMDFARIINYGKAPELKNSLTIMLTSNALHDNIVDETTKFLSDFDQSCDKYESAKQDLSEAQEDEKAVGELKTSMKQLFSQFMPLRNQPEAVNREMERLDKQMTERKAMLARLNKRIENLAGQATTSKQALVGAEQSMKLSAVKKEQAEKTIGDIERLWKSLKVGSSLLLQ